VTQETAREPFKTNLILLGIFLTAFFLRILYLFQLKDHPFFLHPLLDFTYFDLRASEILAGRFFNEDFLFSPLYPYFLAVIYNITGHSLFVPRLVQAILGAVNVILIFHAGRVFWNRHAGLIASVLTALYIPFYYYDGILMATTLIIFLTLLSVNLILAADSSDRSWIFFPAGLIMGLAVLGRPNFLLIPAVLSLWFVFNGGQHKVRKRLFRYFIYLAGIAAIISHITIYYKITHDEWTLVAPHGGINFYIGNHENATGAYMSIPGISDSPALQVRDSMAVAARELGRDLKGNEVSTYWMNKSKKFMRDSPGQFFLLSLKKVALFFNCAEIPSEYGLDFDAKFLSMLRLPLIRFGFVGPFALLGMVVGICRFRKSMMLYLLTGAIMLSVVLFFVHARYRLQGMPYLILFAGFGIYWLIEQVGQKNWKRVSVGLIFLISAVCFTRWDLVEQNFLPGYYNLARSYHAAGDLDKAAEQLQTILEHSESAKTRHFLGTILLEQKNTKKALIEFRIACNLDPGSYPFWMSLGVTEFQSGNIQVAVESFKRAAELDNTLYEPHYNLGMIFFQQGDHVKADFYLKNALDRTQDMEIQKNINMILNEGRSQ